LVIRNGQVADVYRGCFIEGDIAVSGEYIAGIDAYEGITKVDAHGAFILPGLIDGHSPNVRGKELNAYAATGIHTDHECAGAEELHRRLSRGMYTLLRQGSACHDLRSLLKGITPANNRFCVLCSDDRQPKTILEKGHLDDHLRICVEEGIDPMTAIQMATM
jgi:adenine deaminase